REVLQLASVGVVHEDVGRELRDLGFDSPLVSGFQGDAPCPGRRQTEIPSELAQIRRDTGENEDFGSAREMVRHDERPPLASASDMEVSVVDDDAQAVL